MISDEESAKAAAERVQFFLEHPPHEGTPQSVEFTHLLEALANYQSAAQLHHVSASSLTAEQVRELTCRAADLARRGAERRSRWVSFPEDGAGIGPTTGV